MRAVCKFLAEDKRGTGGELAENLLLGHQPHPTHTASSSVPVTPIQTSQKVSENTSRAF